MMPLSEINRAGKAHANALNCPSTSTWHSVNASRIVCVIRETTARSPSWPRQLCDFLPNGLNDESNTVASIFVPPRSNPTQYPLLLASAIVATTFAGSLTVSKNPSPPNRSGSRHCRRRRTPS